MRVRVGATNERRKRLRKQVIAGSNEVRVSLDPSVPFRDTKPFFHFVSPFLIALMSLPFSLYRHCRSAGIEKKAISILVSHGEDRVSAMASIAFFSCVGLSFLLVMDRLFITDLLLLLRERTSGADGIVSHCRRLARRGAAVFFAPARGSMSEQITPLTMPSEEKRAAEYSAAPTDQFRLDSIRGLQQWGERASGSEEW